jgi:hypothetical protein
MRRFDGLEFKQTIPPYPTRRRVCDVFIHKSMPCYSQGYGAGAGVVVTASCVVVSGALVVVVTTSCVVAFGGTNGSGDCLMCDSLGGTSGSGDCLQCGSLGGTSGSGDCLHCGVSGALVVVVIASNVVASWALAVVEGTGREGATGGGVTRSNELEHPRGGATESCAVRFLASLKPTSSPCSHGCGSDRTLSPTDELNAGSSTSMGLY